jgi:hypothetical protein
LLVRKTKRLIELITYGLFDTLVLAGSRRQKDPKVVAIVHLELLGDYVLWLPYGRAMTHHFLHAGHQVVLVLNAGVLPLAQRHFPDCVLIGLDRTAFLKNFKVRAGYLRQLREVGAKIVYHGSYPRDALVEDASVRALGAPAWGFDATFPDRPWLDRWLSRQLYTRLLLPIPGVHQGVRHHAFLHEVGVADDMHIPATFAVELPIPESEPYFVIAPGSSRSERCWPIQSFIALTRQILTSYPEWQCIVIGTRGEYKLGEILVEAVGSRAKNLAGKTNLIELAAWVEHAHFVIGNDSAVCHIAAACDVPSIAIVGGGHYGRCFPYDPDEARMTSLPITVAEKMDCFGCDWICRYRVTRGSPYPCIETIKLDKVWGEVEKLMQRLPAIMKSDVSGASLRESS